MRIIQYDKMVEEEVEESEYILQTCSCCEYIFSLFFNVIHFTFGVVYHLLLPVLPVLQNAVKFSLTASSSYNGLLSKVI